MDTLSKHREDTSNTTDNKELITYKDVENTPFTIIKNENGHMGVIGEFRLTEYYKTEKECIEEVTKINWNRLIQVMWAVTMKSKNLKDE